MAQRLVRNLDLAVKEVRLILRQAVEAGEERAAQDGLGRRIASLFATAELDHPIGEWRAEEAAPAVFDP